MPRSSHSSLRCFNCHPQSPRSVCEEGSLGPAVSSLQKLSSGGYRYPDHCPSEPMWGSSWKIASQGVCPTVTTKSVRARRDGVCDREASQSDVLGRAWVSGAAPALFRAARPVPLNRSPSSSHPPITPRLKPPFSAAFPLLGLKRSRTSPLRHSLRGFPTRPAAHASGRARALVWG